MTQNMKRREVENVLILPGFLLLLLLLLIEVGNARLGESD